MKITAIKQQRKQTTRYSIFVDGAYAFSLSEAALLENRLVTGQELSLAEIAALKKASGLDKAYSSALRLVALRPRSEWEVAAYLKRKSLDEASIAAIVDRLRRAGLLDDEAFARAWVENRRLLKPTSSRRLRLELKQKHVPDTVITQVLAAEIHDESAALRELIAKKRRQERYRADPQRLMQYLARQGFGYDDITRALAADQD